MEWGILRLRPPARAILRAIEEFARIYVYHFTLYMRTKFQASILINKEVLKRGVALAPSKGRLAANRGVINRLS